MEKEHKDGGCCTVTDARKGYNPENAKRNSMGLSEQAEYSARVLINKVLQKDFEKRIESMFNVLVRNYDWDWNKGSFDPYMYCHHKEKQFCGTGLTKPFDLRIDSFHVQGDSLIDCKLQVINWFLHDKPYHPFIQ